MRSIAAAAAAVVLAGCAASGVQVSEKAATQFVEGKSTEAEIVQALGRPTTVSIAGGRRFIAYSGMQYQVKGATFIPIVGVFAGGADYTYSSAMFQIGADGVLEKVTYTSTGSGSRAGTTPVDMPAAEPRAVK